MPQKEPPPPLQEFVSGRRGWSGVVTTTVGWFSQKETEIGGPWPHFILRFGFDQAGQDWWLTAVSTDRVIARARGSYDEVKVELRQVERTLEVFSLLTQCSTQAQAQELIGPMRGRQLEVLRQITEVPRGAAQKVREQIVRRTCGARLDHETIRKAR